jgi:hypothetical protein
MTTGDKVDAALLHCLHLLNGERRATERLNEYLESLMRAPSWSEGEIYDLQLQLIQALAERIASYSSTLESSKN